MFEKGAEEMLRWEEEGESQPVELNLQSEAQFLQAGSETLTIINSSE